MTHGAPAPYIDTGIEYVPNSYAYQSGRWFKFGSKGMSLPAFKVNDDTIIYVLNIMGGDADQIIYFSNDLIAGK